MLSAVENVRNVPCEKFWKVPPVGRCAKQLTFSRWILPNDPVINIWEGIKRVRLNRVGGCFVGRGSCLFEDKKIYLLAHLVLGPNLQLPSHELISPNSIYKALNEGKLSGIKL